MLPSIKQCSVTTLNENKPEKLNRQLNDNTKITTHKMAPQIASINIKQLNVFNTELEAEDNFLFRFANYAHIQTEPDVIHNILLFTEKDTYDAKKLAESERLLRKQRYLYDAQISATENCDGDVDVDVVTRDLWTLLPEINFSRSGGENKSSFGFRESNLFGWGKRLSLSRTSDSDRTGYLFVYDDPNVLSSRYKARIEYADNNDGKRHRLELTYPFYAINTPFSYGALSYKEERKESIYSKGDIVSEYKQDTQLQRFFLGHSKKLSHSWTQRISGGYINEDNTFNAIESTLLPLALDRSLSYPFISGHWFEDHYIKVRNFDTIHRTEDLNLGWNIKTLFGYSSQSLSNDESRVVYSLDINKALFSNEQTLWRFDANIDGYWNRELKQLENFIATSKIQYYLNTQVDESWYIKAQVQLAEHLTYDKQLTLGGETGLRGYPIDYQHGDRSWLISLEKRYYWDYNFLQLFKVGGAAFVDVGKAWFSNAENTLVENNDDNILKNVGIGLRLAPSRANAGTVIHLDIAAPLQKTDDVDSLQWLVSVKNSF
ncbi:BamA/TamA family outer membrane protein [Pseudoalteromonas sp. MMG010]|uniref:BamA/TamA family outer membrane protein n=1 Tax=Pseudoalteromonas sp. MMG010 TaxID=2822685 RepID=UPI0032B5A135